MVSVDHASIDVIAAGAPSGHYQILLAQSTDTGASWSTDMDLTHDTANTYYYPDMVRDGNDLHVTYVKSGTGGQYLHSADGGATWDTPYSFGNSSITPFIAYMGCALHVILPDNGHINYFRNPTGNAGTHCATGISFVSTGQQSEIKLYPNPFTSETTIEILSSENAKNAVLKIFDVPGKEMMSSVFGNENKITLGRDKLGCGIYFYKVFEKEKIIAAGKMIIEKYYFLKNIKIEMKLRLFIILSVFAGMYVNAQDILMLDSNVTYQTLDGWGHGEGVVGHLQRTCMMLHTR